MLLVICCNSCNKNINEKFQKHRDHIINVEDKIIDIKTDTIFGFSVLYILDDILIVSEVQPRGNRGIHLYNKNTFEYIASTGILGKGPGEIARSGNIGIDRKNRILWIADHGKKLRWKFYLDSALNSDLYKPTVSIDINYDIFMERYGFLNDSIVIGKAVRILPDHSFTKAMAKLYLNTNNIKLYGYEHDKAIGKKSYSSFKLSIENNIYVNCYSNLDLVSICDLDGNIKYNVYGPGWLKNRDNKNDYFTGVDLFSNHIIASYLGGVSIFYDEYKRPRGNLPSKFLLFDLEGNYKETIETGYKFQTFCVDEENNRVIVYFDGRENPLGYFNLNID